MAMYMQQLTIKRTTPILPRENPIRSILSSNMKKKINFCLKFNLKGRKKHMGSK